MTKYFKPDDIIINKNTGKKFRVIKKEKIPNYSYFGNTRGFEDCYQLIGVWKRAAPFHQMVKGVHGVYTKEEKKKVIEWDNLSKKAQDKLKKELAE